VSIRQRLCHCRRAPAPPHPTPPPPPHRHTPVAAGDDLEGGVHHRWEGGQQRSGDGLPARDEGPQPLPLGAGVGDATVNSARGGGFFEDWR